jgi:hypothetical protein
MNKIPVPIRKAFLLFTLILSVQMLPAQSFEIRSVNKGGGVIGVEMRATSAPAPTTADFVTDIVFGLKWSESYNVDLGAVMNTTPSYSITKSGVRSLKSGFHFQAFYANNVPYNFPSNWVVNNWVEIMSIKNTLTGTGTGTFEIAETGFDVTTNPNIAVNLVDFTPVINGRADFVNLPVNLKSFEVTTAGRAIKLNWSTTNEHNNAGFDVERSEAEINKFQKIGWVESTDNNNRNGEYQFNDENVVAKVRYYFRLKQVDKDGKFTFSDVKSAMIDKLDNALIHVKPNPADKMLQLFFNGYQKNTDVSIQIFDPKGSLMHTRTATVDAKKRIDLDVSNLLSGQYFLLVKSPDGSNFSTIFQKR